METSGEQGQRHSFVIILWSEDAPAESPHSGWRGHITYVPTGERRYLSKLCEVVSFIGPYIGSPEPPNKRQGTLARWWACYRRAGQKDCQ